jgi:DNA-binding NarL/FixJ family response regulator
VPVEPAGTFPYVSPLRDFLRTRIERILASWEAADAPSAAGPDRLALQRFLDALDELAEATDALAGPPVGETAPVAQPGQKRVLIVASESPLAAETRRLLETDHRVDEAAPDLAFRSAAARTPDLVVAFGAAGLATVRGFRELNAGLPAIVVAPADQVARMVGELAQDPAVVVRDTASADELALTVRGVLAAGAGWDRGEEAGDSSLPAVKLAGEPRSYAHLAGLLPRALERTIQFDVGAAVIARPQGEPLVDVHATSDCPEQTIQLVRERALSIFRVVAGGAHSEQEPSTTAFPLRSSLHVPLATEGRVVGLTLLAAFRADAFSSEDERVLAALATHASGAYRRLEASLRRLRLTPRQSQVLSLIASGLSDKEVASRLGLAHRTVRTHLDRLLREHGLHSRTEAVAAWLRGQQG